MVNNSDTRNGKRNLLEPWPALPHRSAHEKTPPERGFFA